MINWEIYISWNCRIGCGCLHILITMGFGDVSHYCWIFIAWREKETKQKIRNTKSTWISDYWLLIDDYCYYQHRWNNWLDLNIDRITSVQFSSMRVHEKSKAVCIAYMHQLGKITCFFLKCVGQQIVLIVVCTHAIVFGTECCVASANGWLSHKQWLLNGLLNLLWYTSWAASHSKLQLKWSHIDNNTNKFVLLLLVLLFFFCSLLLKHWNNRSILNDFLTNCVYFACLLIFSYCSLIYINNGCAHAKTKRNQTKQEDDAISIIIFFVVVVDWLVGCD